MSTTNSHRLGGRQTCSFLDTETVDVHTIATDDPLPLVVGTCIPREDQCCDLQCCTSLQSGSTEDVYHAYSEVMPDNAAGQPPDVAVSSSTDYNAVVG